MLTLLWILGMTAWFAATGAMLIWAAVAAERSRTKALWIAFASVFVFAVPLAWVITAMKDTPLCLRGHEQMMMVGKTMNRVWVCEDRR